MSKEQEDAREVGCAWEFEDYDPFALDGDDLAEPVADSDGDAVDPEYSPEVASNLEAPLDVGEERADARTPEQRIDDLMDSMGLRAATLRRIIVLCEEPCRVCEVNERVEALQQSTYSVFSAANLCALLERAGALRRVCEDGSPYEVVDTSPRTLVDENGLEYLEVTEAPPVYWVATPEGLQAVARYAPAEGIRSLLFADDAYLPIYERVLCLCAEPDGAPMATIAQAVDNDPLVQNPRYLGSYFVERLERVGAIEWASPWRITESGAQVLGELGVASAPQAREEEDAL